MTPTPEQPIKTGKIEDVSGEIKQWEIFLENGTEVLHIPNGTFQVPGCFIDEPPFLFRRP